MNEGVKIVKTNKGVIIEKSVFFSVLEYTGRYKHIHAF